MSQRAGHDKELYFGIRCAAGFAVMLRIMYFEFPSVLFERGVGRALNGELNRSKANTGEQPLRVIAELRLLQSKPPILFDLIRTTLSSCRANGYAEIYRYFGVYQSHSAIAIITKLKCFVEFAMALIWRKHLSVGNAMLDSEHKNLIGIVNCIEYAINTKDSNALLKTIRSLKDCADTHFSNEARFMRALNIPMAQHELVHQHLQKELQQTIDELVVKGNTWTEYAMDYYSQLLMDWLIEHINTEDMLMKPVLESHPYDFKPV